MSVPDSYPEASWKGTLDQKIVAMDNMKEEAVAAFKGADSVFCTLGTTRGVCFQML